MDLELAAATASATRARSTPGQTITLRDVSRLPSFEGHRDDPESPFYCAAGLTPQETWDEITECLTRTLLEAAEQREAGRELPKLETVVGFHEAIFKSTFPDEAGRLRSKLPDGTWEHVEFGIDVGTALTRTVRPMRGTHPSRIEVRVNAACQEFVAVAEELISGSAAATLRTATDAAARLYAKLLTIHPFVDGNLRAAYATLQSGLLAVDLPLIEFPDLREHDDAIALALRVDSRQTYEPLSRLIEGVLKDAQ